MADTNISWATFTHNFLSWCEKVSDECANCYAINMSRRLEAMGQARYIGVAHKPGKRTQWVPPSQMPGGVRVSYEAMLKFPRRKKRMWVFVNSMSDSFHGSVPHAAITRYMNEVVAKNPQHVFMFLTKRPENMAAWAQTFGPDRLRREFKNCMWGITAGVQKSLDERLPHLLKMPGTRWVSAEPLLEGVTLPPEAIGLHYIVIGGESGTNARPMHPGDARRLIKGAVRYGIPVHFKQWGEFLPINQLTPEQRKDAQWDEFRSGSIPKPKYKRIAIGGNVYSLRMGKKKTEVRPGVAEFDGRVIHEAPLLTDREKAARLWRLGISFADGAGDIQRYEFRNIIGCGTVRELYEHIEDAHGVTIAREVCKGGVV